MNNQKVKHSNSIRKYTFLVPVVRIQSCWTVVLHSESCFWPGALRQHRRHQAIPQSLLDEVDSRSFKAFLMIPDVLQFGCWSGLFSEPSWRTWINFILRVTDHRTIDLVFPLGCANNKYSGKRTLLASSFFSWLRWTASALVDNVLSPTVGAGRCRRKNGQGMRLCGICPEYAPSLQLFLFQKERLAEGLCSILVVARPFLVTTLCISRMFLDLELCVYM